MLQLVTWTNDDLKATLDDFFVHQPILLTARIKCFTQENAILLSHAAHFPLLPPCFQTSPNNLHPCTSLRSTLPSQSESKWRKASRMEPNLGGPPCTGPHETQQLGWKLSMRPVEMSGNLRLPTIVHRKSIYKCRIVHCYVRLCIHDIGQN